MILHQSAWEPLSRTSQPHRLLLFQNIQGPECHEAEDSCGPSAGKEHRKVRGAMCWGEPWEGQAFFLGPVSSLTVPTGKGSSWKQPSLTNRTNTSLKSDCLENSQLQIPGSKEMFWSKINCGAQFMKESPPPSWPCSHSLVSTEKLSGDTFSGEKVS